MALKVLPTDVAAHAHRLARREARAVAGLLVEDLIARVFPLDLLASSHGR